MENNDRNELDGIIEQALSGYSAMEPRAGLQDRIVNRLHIAEADQRGFKFWPWAIAFGIVTSLIFMAIVIRMEHRPTPKTNNIARTRILPAPRQPAYSPEPSTTEPRAALKRGGKTAMKHVASRLLPKDEHFPIDAPITGEERALRAFIERNPAEAQQVFTDLRRRNNEPIDIHEIQIDLLQTDSNQ